MATQRNKGEGTLETRKDGLMRYRGQVKGCRVSGSWMATKRAALADFQTKRKTKLRQIESGKQAIEIPTVALYAHDTVNGPYRERVKNGTMSPRTWSLYETILAVHLDGSKLGGMRIDKVKPEHVEEWIAGLTSPIILSKDGKRVIRPSMPVAPSTKTRYAGFLQGVFTRARVASELIAGNAVQDAEKPISGEAAFRILDGGEIGRLMELADRWEAERTLRKEIPQELSGRCRLIVHLALHAIGPAEMCGLHTDAFDGEGVSIEMQANDGKPTSRLKTRRRKGWVPVSGELAALLQKCPRGWVLRTTTGAPMQDGNLRRLFKSMVKGTEFAGLKPYDLRHTFAMQALEKGVDVRTVAEILRNTPRVVLEKYARSRTELKRTAIETVFKKREPTLKTNPK